MEMTEWYSEYWIIQKIIFYRFFSGSKCWTHILFVVDILFVSALQELPVWWAGMSGVKMYLAQVQILNRIMPVRCEFITWHTLLDILLDSDDHTDEESELVQPQEVDPSRGELREFQVSSAVNESLRWHHCEKSASYSWILNICSIELLVLVLWNAVCQNHHKLCLHFLN